MPRRSAAQTPPQQQPVPRERLALELAQQLRPRPLPWRAPQDDD
jgi:hypothetical protein